LFAEKCFSGGVTRTRLRLALLKVSAIFRYGSSSTEFLKIDETTSDLVMGIVADTLFWQGHDQATSVMGILFQSMFFVSVGAMLKVAPQYEVRGILYKHQDANFFPTWTYVFGRSLAGLPSSIIDGVVYGTLVFWFVGLAHNDGASIGNYFMFVFLIMMASVAIGLVFSIFSAVTRDRSTGQGERGCLFY
jgi:hypothetical protein